MQEQRTLLLCLGNKAQHLRREVPRRKNEEEERGHEESLPPVTLLWLDSVANRVPDAPDRMQKARNGRSGGVEQTAQQQEHHELGVRLELVLRTHTGKSRMMLTRQAAHSERDTQKLPAYDQTFYISCHAAETP
jgi:hypothetical protein